MKRIALGALVALVLTLAAAAIAATTIELTQDQLNKICDQNPAQCSVAKQPPALVCTPPAVLNASATACVSGGTGSGGTTGGDFSCTNHPVLVLDWANPRRLLTRDYGGFAPNEAIVIQFTTGIVQTTGTNLPRVAVAEYDGPPTTRLGVLSSKPCDFSQPQALFYAESNSLTTTFAIGAPYTVFGMVIYPGLAANTTYYLNVRNSGCLNVATGCNVFVDLVKAGGL